MHLNYILQKFKVKSASKGIYYCLCPAHDDHNPSLTITQDKSNGNILINCFAGCKIEDILNKVDLLSRDLFNNKHTAKSHIEIARYNYYNEKKDLIHCTIRYIDNHGNKSFKQGNYLYSQFKFGLQGMKTYLYKLPELIEDIKQGKDIFIVEGEKDVDNLRKLGLSATTSPMGANKWRKHYNPYFVGANVYIIPDNDKAGFEHSKLVYDNIKDFAKSVRIIHLPNLEEKQDISDWLNLGNTIEDLYTLINGNTPKSILNDLNQNIETKSIIDKKEFKAIREYIYTKEDKPKILQENVVNKILECYNICFTEFSGRKTFLIYDDGYWREISKEQIAPLFKDWLKESDRQVKTYDNIINHIFYVEGAFVREDLFNSKHNKINLNNCTFNLDTYEAEPFNPKDYFAHKLPYDYDKNAKCPLFLDVLNLYSNGIRNWTDLFFEIAGYTLTGSFEYQKMFWFVGNTGRNGKGTCIRVLEHLVGDNFTISGIDSKELSERFYLHRFVNKRLATTGDLPTKLLNIAILKQLTGGDKQTTDVKFGNPISFQNNAKIIFAMNKIPKMPKNESIEPVIKRIEFLIFEYEIKEPNSKVEILILQELSGIFNLAVEGLKRLRENGKFTQLKESEYYINKLKGDISLFEEFVSLKITYDSELTNDGTFTYELFNEYQLFMIDEYSNSNWAILDKGNNNPISQSQLTHQIRDYFHQRGIELKSKQSYSAEKKGKQALLLNIIIEG